MTVLVITGSRCITPDAWPYPGVATEVLEMALRLGMERFDRPFGSIAEVIHGGSGGVDMLADVWARGNGIRVTVIKPEYKAYPPSQRYDVPKWRNREMVYTAGSSGVVIGVWCHNSGGTANCVAWGVALGRPTYCHPVCCPKHEALSKEAAAWRQREAPQGRLR